MEKPTNNNELQKAVQDAINFKSPLNAATIIVLAIDGVIILTGTVDSYARKWRAEDTAKNVAGVSAVVDALEIKSGSVDDKIDMEITRKVLSALKLNFFVHVTLSGQVHRLFQKEAAIKSAGSVAGVKALTDEVVITACEPAYC
jgi:osmotically-inducible protein OsmY